MVNISHTPEMNGNWGHPLSEVQFEFPHVEFSIKPTKEIKRILRTITSMKWKKVSKTKVINY